MCRRRRARVGRCLGLLLSLPASLAFAAEYTSQQGPVPSRAGDLLGPLGYAFTRLEEQPWYLLDDIKAGLEDSHPFISDTRLSLDFRTFSFDRKTPDGDAWAVGGQLQYQSGDWNGLSAGAAWYNSTEIDSGGVPTGLLGQDNENINVLGEAYLRYRFDQPVIEGSELTLYRQKLSLPYMNTQDIRMLPNTHEGYLLQRADSSFDYVLGHVTKFKKRDDDEFRYLSEAAGAPGTDKGASVVGTQFPLGENLTLGAINLYGWDTFNTFYSETSYRNRIDSNTDFKLSGQYTHQRSVGDELVDDFKTWHGALQAALGWRGGILRLAGSRTAASGRLRGPWGGKPSYLSIQRSDFDSANERAVMLGLSYNTEYFSSLGLSSFVNIARGWDRRVASQGVDLPDRIEYNLTVDYKPPAGMLRGLWVRFRWAQIDLDGDGETVRDLRLIVNYRLPML